MSDVEVGHNGPYAVHGLPLARLRYQPAKDSKDQAWVERESVDVSAEAGQDGTYWLCRCGHSANKPFCDGSHKRVGFDGTESAARTSQRDQAKVMLGDGVVVRDARAICQHAGFCSADGSNVWRMVNSSDPVVLEAMKGMVDHCPSGALTRAATEASTEDVEPTLPLHVWVVDDGPYLVTGGATIASADGTAYADRNRVTLCRCGASATKPLCDGSHAKPEVAFRDA